MVDSKPTTEGDPRERDGSDEPEDRTAESEMDGAGLPPSDAEDLLGGEALADLRAEAARAAELADRLKRVEAEFVNETRRIREKSERDRKYAVDSLVQDLLPVLDAFEGAAKGLPDNEVGEQTRAGLAIIERQLLGVLEKRGVSEVEAAGQSFDPACHEAIYQVEREDIPPGEVAEVLRRGFRLHERVVRPAQVSVSRAPESSGSGGDEEQAAGSDEA